MNLIEALNTGSHLIKHPDCEDWLRIYRYRFSVHDVLRNDWEVAPAPEKNATVTKSELLEIFRRAEEHTWLSGDGDFKKFVLQDLGLD